ncbi:MAG: hypothetical protein OXU73_01840 [Candidatus Campbellbacteria bacterium]|nr:hypothetical protein [Candidatus Campbellbacteria bacterium]
MKNIFNNKNKIFLATYTTLLFPVFAFAQEGGETTGIGAVIEGVENIIASTFNILFALAFLFFIYRLTLFLLSSEDTDRKEKMRYIMISLVILAVMFSFYGIVRIIQSTICIRGETISRPVGSDAPEGSGPSSGQIESPIFRTEPVIIERNGERVGASRQTPRQFPRGTQFQQTRCGDVGEVKTPSITQEIINKLVPKKR